MPGFTVQSTHIDAPAVQLLQGIRMNLAFRTAAGTGSHQPGLTQVPGQRFRQDATTAVVGAEKQDTERLICHDSALLLIWFRKGFATLTLQQAICYRLGYDAASCMQPADLPAAFLMPPGSRKGWQTSD